MHSSKTFIVLLGLAYFTVTKAQTSSLAVPQNASISPTNDGSMVSYVATVSVTVNVTAGYTATAAAAASAAATPAASAAATPAASSAGGGGGVQATTAVSGGSAPPHTQTANAPGNPTPTTAAGGNVAPTSTANGAPPASSHVAPAPAASSSVKLVTPAPPKALTMEIKDLKINKPFSADYNNKSSPLFNTLQENLTAALNKTLHAQGLVNVTILSVKSGSIIVDMKLFFLVPSSSDKNIEDVIKNDKNNTLSNLGIDLKTLKVEYPDVQLGEWEPKANECQKKCCDGAGGEIILQRKCKKGSCRGIALEKEHSPCTDKCSSSDCSSGTSVKASISTFILAALVLIRTLA